MRIARLGLTATLAITAVAISGLGSTSSPVSALVQDVTQFDLVAPIGSSEQWGRDVKVLPNGNYVIVDERFSTGAAFEIGAVFLYDGRTNELISTLTGSTEDDQLGRTGIDVLADSRFVVASPDWDHPDGTPDVGAVTLVDGTTGLDGVVTPDNSIHGTQAFDQVGAQGTVPLNSTAGNFVIRSLRWNHPNGTRDVGAATWVDGANPFTGPVTLDNSLHGLSANDAVSGTRVIALENGDYIVSSARWNHPDGTTDVGAMTVGNGATGTVGPVTVDNSLHGNATDDEVGASDVELTNGNVVTSSDTWDHPDGTTDVGAVTLIDPAAPLVGPVTPANSLHGTSAGDRIGNSSVVPLSDGDYVVASPIWSIPGALTVPGVGAATRGDGTVGVTGPVTVDNSLHGTTANDAVGTRVRALNDGAYVVASQLWQHPNGAAKAGAVTWVSGTSDLTGPVTVDNSLHGTTANDEVGDVVVVLTNGNYLAASETWDDPDGAAGPVVNAGAVTWANGATGITGPVSRTNSLHGSVANERVGDRFSSVFDLANGNYVIATRSWDHPDGTENVGAATWGDGTVGVTGPITVDNSLHGTTANDEVGDDIEPLGDGNYVVTADGWDHPDGTVDVGAAVWADGTAGLTGPVTLANSLHGTTAGDDVGQVIRAVSTPVGAYVTFTDDWDDPDGAVVDTGAATFGLPGGATTGPVTRTNSAIGQAPADFDGVDRSTTLGDGIVVETDRRRVIILQFDREPFFADATPAVTAATGPGADTATVDFTTPVATDLRSTPTTVCTPGSGTSFPVGDTRVSCVATDSSGQTATTLFTVTVTATPALPDQPDQPADVQAVVPARILETRPGLDTDDGLFQTGVRVPAGTEIEIDVAGRGNIPDNATAAFLNVTAINPDRSGFLTVHPCGDDRPNASNVNYTANAVAPNAVLAQLSSTGTICVFTVGTTDLIIDTAGFVPNGGTTTAVAPERILDTRPGFPTADGQFAGAGRVDAGTFIEVDIAGRGNVAADATAAFLNVTAVRPDTRGFLTVYPCTPEPPNTSNVNYTPGSVSPNAVLAQLSPNGTICVFTRSTTDVLIDTAGFTPPASSTKPVEPARILETRRGLTTDDGLFQTSTRVPAGTEIEIDVAGRGNIPANATAAFLNVTAINPDNRGFLTVHPCSTERPNTSNVNYTPGSVSPNAVLAQLSPTGTICIFTRSTTDLIIDTAGFTTN